MIQTSTNVVRIDKDILDKIKSIAKNNGQTISGYINISLSKAVEREWAKFTKQNKID
jgi:antitoxin component of RelBE/YafQ-DinJ toxin-antitoxin module